MIARDKARVIAKALYAMYAIGIVALVAMAALAPYSGYMLAASLLRVYSIILIAECAALIFSAMYALRPRISSRLFIPSMVEAVRLGAGGITLIVVSLLADSALGTSVSQFAALVNAGILSAVTMTATGMLLSSRKLLGLASIASGLAGLGAMSVALYVTVYALYYMLHYGALSMSMVRIAVIGALLAGLFMPSFYNKLVLLAMEASHQ